MAKQIRPAVSGAAALALAFTLTLTLAGCDRFGGGPPTTEQMQDVKLADVAELYRTYQVSYKKPPRSLRDFSRLGDAAAPTGYEAIRSGEVVVRWQATLPETTP